MKTIKGLAGRSEANKRTPTNYKRRGFKEVGQFAQGNWFYVHSFYGISTGFLKPKHGPCPICGGKDRFRYDNKGGNGTFICSRCGAGDGFKLLSLVRGITLAESLRLVADYFGLGGVSCFPAPIAKESASVNSSSKQVNQSRLNTLNCIWTQSKSVIPGDPVHTYLTVTRQLNLSTIPDVLRYHEGLEYFEDGKSIGTFPAMVALVMSPDNQMVCIHRTFLTIDGRKAPVAKPKKLMPPIFEGATKGAAIRLYEATNKLAITEGIETGLACHSATGLPVWSGISANGMSAIEVPVSVEEVIIFADHDANNAGENAAKTLARRLLAADKKVKLLVPSEAGTDWFDFVTGKGGLDNG